MPRISWEAANAGSDLISGQVPEILRPEQAATPGTALDVAAAAIRQNSAVYSAWSTFWHGRPQDAPAVPGYSPYAKGILSGYEDFQDRFVRSRSPEETEAIKARIDQERLDQKVQQASGGWGTAASIAAGVLDPLTILSMAIPVAAPEAFGSRVARVGAAVGANAAADVVSEVALQRAHETRPLSESAFNIAAGAVLTGLFGAVVSKVPKTEFELLRKKLGEDLNAARGGSTAGAAAASDTFNLPRLPNETEAEYEARALADEGIATSAGRAIAKTVGQISPLTRLMTSPFKGTRQLAQKLLQVPYLTNKALRGVPSAPAVEDIVKMRVAQAKYQLVTDYEKSFVEYSTRTEGEGVKLRAFGAEVVRALRSGDKSEIPEAAALASKIRQTFDADKKALQELGVLPEDFQLIGAQSYFPRVYDHAAIAADPVGLRMRLKKWFTDNPFLPIGPRDAVSKIEQAPNETSRFFSEDAGTFAGKNARSVVLRDRSNREIGRLVFVDRGDHLQIARTQLAPNWKGQGFGQRMIAELIDEAEHVGKGIKSDSVVTADQLKAYWGLRNKGYGIEFADEEAVKKAIKDGTELREAGGVVRSMQSPQLILKVLEEESKAAKTAMQAAKKSRVAGKRVNKQARLAFDRAMRRMEKVDDTLGEMKAQGAPADAIARMEARMQRTEARIQELKKTAIEAEADFEKLTGTSRSAIKTARTASKAVRKQKAFSAQAERTAASTKRLNEKAAEPVFREPGEVDLAVEETINNILGTVRGMADIGGTVPGARPLRSRTLDVPDEILEPYLVDDLETVMNGYSRAMIPQIEMRRAFGSASMNSQLEEIANTANVKIAQSDNPVEIKKLREQLSKDLTRLEALRDRVLGQAGPRGSDKIPAWFVSANRIARAYNLVRLLGGQTLSSLSDYGHAIMSYGLVRTGAMTVKFLTNVKANKLIRADAKRLGTALDWTIDTRGQTLADIGDELAGSKADRMAQWATHAFSRLSGMATWNSAIKAITAALEQDAILRAATSGNISKYKKAVLASSGIDDNMLGRIGKQYAKYGEDTDGLARARTDLWDDKEAAQTFESSVVKAADTVVITRGQGDVPLMMSNELVKTLFQFKSFGMSSVNRLMIPLAQGLSHADMATVNGFAAMMGLGALTYAAKEWAAGREPDLANPRRVISESANWSGVLGFLPDVYDPVAGAFNMPRLSRYTSRMPIESLLGPTYGTATSAYTMLNKITNGELEQTDVHQVRQMLPLQNLFYIRRIVNAMEGEAGEAMGAAGATHGTFVGRAVETKPPEESK